MLLDVTEEEPDNTLCRPRKVNALDVYDIAMYPCNYFFPMAFTNRKNFKQTGLL